MAYISKIKIKTHTNKKKPMVIILIIRIMKDREDEFTNSLIPHFTNSNVTTSQLKTLSKTERMSR